LFTTKTLGIKLSRINPLKGFKRIFSLKSLVELLKSIIKIALVGYIGYGYIKGEMTNVLGMMDVDVVSSASFSWFYNFKRGDKNVYCLCLL